MVYGMVYILCIQQILIMTKLLKSSEKTPLVAVACTVSSTKFLDEPASSFLLNGIKHDNRQFDSLILLGSESIQSRAPGSTRER